MLLHCVEDIGPVVLLWTHTWDLAILALIGLVVLIFVLLFASLPSASIL